MSESVSISVKIAAHDKGCNFAMFLDGAEEPFATGQVPLADAAEVARRLGADPSFVEVEHNTELPVPPGPAAEKFTDSLPPAEAEELAAQWVEPMPPSQPEAPLPPDQPAPGVLSD